MIDSNTDVFGSGNGAIRKFKDGSTSSRHSLAEVRICIDAIDTNIVLSLAERAKLVRAATCFKLTKTDSSDLHRQAVVIQHVRSLAEAQHSELDGFPDLVEALYSTLLPNFADLQQKEFKNTLLTNQNSGDERKG